MHNFFFKFLVALSLVVSVSASSANTLEVENYYETLQLLKESLEAHDKVKSVVINSSDESLTIKLKSGGELFAYPDNLFTKLKQAASQDERLVELQNHMQSLLSTIESDVDRNLVITSENLGSIRTLIRHKSLSNSYAAQGVSVVSREFVGDMLIYVAIDTPQTVEYLTQQILDTNNFGLDDLIERGLKNLPNAPELQRLDGGLTALVYDGTYEASFLLDDPFWNRLHKRNGDFLMVAPNRDIIIYSKNANQRSKTSVAELRDAMLEQGSYPLSEMIYKRTASGWQVAK